MKIQVKILWIVTPCSDVVGHQCFGGPCCLHIQHFTLKTMVWSFFIMNNSNLWAPVFSEEHIQVFIVHFDPYYYGMTLSHLANEGDAPPLSNILDKHSGQPTTGGPSGCGWDRRLKPSSLRNDIL